MFRKESETIAHAHDVSRFFRRWRWWLGGVVGVVLAVTVIGPFVFLHVIEKAAPPPLSLTPAAGSALPAAAATPQAPVTFAGTYRVVSGSQAQYRVQETLFGQSATAVGSTSAINGSLVVAGTSITHGEFSVPLATVQSDQSMRDAQFDNRIMDIADYPNATFKLAKTITMPAPPPVATVVNQSATGDLTLHGVTKTVTFAVQVEYTGSQLKLGGNIPITFADWNIGDPSGGPAQVGSTGTLGFLLVLSH